MCGFVFAEFWEIRPVPTSDKRSVASGNCGSCPGPRGGEDVVIPALPLPLGRRRGPWENKCMMGSHTVSPQPPFLWCPACLAGISEVRILVSWLFGQRHFHISGTLIEMLHKPQARVSATGLLTSHRESASPQIPASDSGTSVLLDVLPQTRRSPDPATPPHTSQHQAL